jgi:hypothetical protein
MCSSNPFSDFSLINFHRYSLFNPSIITPQIDSSLKYVDNFDLPGLNRRVCTETALSDELNAKQSISEISCKSAKMEEEHRSFRRTGSASIPLPHRLEESFWNLDISQFFNNIEKF